jgi:hypothetical protein
VLAYRCHRGQSLPQAVSHLSKIVASKPNPIFLQAIAEHFGTALSRGQLAELDQQLMRGALDGRS